MKNQIRLGCAVLLLAALFFTGVGILIGKYWL